MDVHRGGPLVDQPNFTDHSVPSCAFAVNHVYPVNTTFEANSTDNLESTFDQRGSPQHGQTFTDFPASDTDSPPCVMYEVSPNPLADLSDKDGDCNKGEDDCRQLASFADVTGITTQECESDNSKSAHTGSRRKRTSGHVARKWKSETSLKDEKKSEKSLSPIKADTFPKKARTHFNPVQVAAMERRFSMNPYPTTKEREEIAKSLDLHDVQIQVWFQNRRAKMRRKDKNFAQIYLTPSRKRKNVIVSIPGTPWEPPKHISVDTNNMPLGINGFHPKLPGPPESNPTFPQLPSKFPHPPKFADARRNGCIIPHHHTFAFPEQNGRCVPAYNLMPAKMLQPCGNKPEYVCDFSLPTAQGSDPVVDMLSCKNTQPATSANGQGQDGMMNVQVSPCQPTQLESSSSEFGVNVCESTSHMCTPPVNAPQIVHGNSPGKAPFAPATQSISANTHNLHDGQTGAVTNFSGSTPPNYTLPVNSSSVNGSTGGKQQKVDNSCPPRFENGSFAIKSPPFSGYFPAPPPVAGFFSGPPSVGGAIGGVGGALPGSPAPFFGFQQNNQVLENQGYLFPVFLSYPDPSNTTGLLPVGQPAVQPPAVPSSSYGV